MTRRATKATAHQRAWAVARHARMEGASPQEVYRVVRALCNGALDKDEQKALAIDAIRSAAGSADDPLTLIRASDVRRKATRWAWEGRVPMRSASLIAGRKGLGKSQFLDWVTAALTRGQLDGAYLDEPVAVIRASPEDTPEETLKPRLEAARADLDLVYFVALGLDEGGFLTLPDDVDRLKGAVERTEAALVALDPITAFLSDSTKPNDEASVRRALMPLVFLARDVNTSVLASIHLNKKTDHDALMRVIGSVGFVNVVRSVLFMGRDPHDPDPDRGPLRVIAHGACNVGREQPSLAAHIEPVALKKRGADEATITSRLVVGGETDVRANQLLSMPDPEEHSERDAAAKWLEAQLREGPKPSGDLLKRCRAEVPCSEKTLRRAKDAIGAVAEQTAEGWVWRLPRKERA